MGLVLDRLMELLMSYYKPGNAPPEDELLSNKPKPQPDPIPQPVPPPTPPPPPPPPPGAANYELTGPVTLTGPAGQGSDYFTVKAALGQSLGALTVSLSDGAEGYFVSESAGQGPSSQTADTVISSVTIGQTLSGTVSPVQNSTLVSYTDSALGNSLALGAYVLFASDPTRLYTVVALNKSTKVITLNTLFVGPTGTTTAQKASARFRYVPVAEGARYVATTSAGLINPAAITFTATAPLEGLSEMVRRKGRRARYAFPANLLENSVSFVWQPETLIFTDLVTGVEHCKMSQCHHASGHNSFYHNDIAITPWSADGKRMALTLTNRPSKFWSTSDRTAAWYLVRTDGTYLRPAAEAAMRLGTFYWHWSPQNPDVAWQNGGGGYLGATSLDTKFYKTTVSDTSCPSVAVFDVSNIVPVDGVDVAVNPSLTSPKKLISGDGKRLVLCNQTFIIATNKTRMALLPLQLVGTPGPLLARPYVPDRDYGAYGDMAYNDPTLGITVTDTIQYHDIYMDGLGEYLFALPSPSTVPTTGGSVTYSHAIIWRQKVLGSAADGGPVYTAPVANVFGEIEPYEHAAINVSPAAGNVAAPWCNANGSYSTNKVTYVSHFSCDRWGTLTLGADGRGIPDPNGGLFNVIGMSVWDGTNHVHVVPCFGYGGSHPVWTGFTDWVATDSNSTTLVGTGGGQLEKNIVLGKYNVATSARSVAKVHSMANGNGYDTQAYNYSYVRPLQSPDGTKIAYHSTWLRPTDSLTDIFWVAVYAPYPPTDLDAITTGTNGQAKVRWLPPRYTARDWLDGTVLYGREIASYHLWRATSSVGPWTHVATIPAYYANDPTSNILRPTVSSGGAFVDGSHKLTYTDAPGAGTFYYALTSEEHSGLESKNLSDVLSVTISGASVSSSVAVIGGPPTVQRVGNSQAGQTSFWTTAPAAPSGLGVAAGAVSTTNTLSWTEPIDPKVRYYNIYYSNSTTNPTAVRANRIASLRIGTNRYVDWLAAASGGHRYAITSVDRYGNESTPAFAP